MSSIKIGSRVQVTKLVEFDRAYGIYIGACGTVRSVNVRSRKPSAYINWDDHDADIWRFMFQDQLELIEEDEPDLYLYPDTPKGTKIVAIQDTVSAYGINIPKGSALELQAMTYACGGTHIAASWDGSYRNGVLVNVEHFMILEDQP